jgi:hypothetical protein
VSTAISNTFPANLTGCRQALNHFISELEAGPDLFRPERLAKRLTALDELDALIGGPTALAACSDSRIIARVWALRTRLEAANRELYEHARVEIVREGNSRTFCQWLLGPESDTESLSRYRGLRFDLRDEIVNGVLQLREPNKPDLSRSPEMLPYQPTPARHILDLIATSRLSNDDILVDLGSGLGHVPLMVSILTGNRTMGVEIQPAYVASARECARTLRIKQARFVAEDARRADLSNGTLFYLYSPFTGSILTDVLSRLRKEAAERQVRICSLGPCTRILQDQEWLQANPRSDSGRIAIFKSQ